MPARKPFRGHAGSRGRRLGRLAVGVCFFGAEGRCVVGVSSRLRRALADRDSRICRMRELQVTEPDEFEQRVDPERSFDFNTPFYSPRSETKVKAEGYSDAACCTAV
jgi:hypothetical protein